MIELKIKDIESLNAITLALRKNEYMYSTFVVWGKDGCIDRFVVDIGGKENERKQTS